MTNLDIRAILLKNHRVLLDELEREKKPDQFIQDGILRAFPHLKQATCKDGSYTLDGREVAFIDPSFTGVRISYEWLAAQKRTKRIGNQNTGFKHTIERWAGHYISPDEVKLAAFLHPSFDTKMEGNIMYLNLSKLKNAPHPRRLKNIACRHQHKPYDFANDFSYYDGYEKFPFDFEPIKRNLRNLEPDYWVKQFIN